MSKVDWENAPEDAEFFSACTFRKHVDGLEYAYIYDEWDIVYPSEAIHIHERDYHDFEERPTSGVTCGVATPEDTDIAYKVSEIEVKFSPDTMYNFDSGAIKSEWTGSHYDNFYQLTEADIQKGYIKVDAYFVNKMWKLNSKDDTGCLFHSLKTIARFGDKNPVERELKALYAQTKRMAELYGVELE